MSDTPDTPTTIPEAHDAALRIGEKLATTTNQHSIFTRDGSPTLKFGPDWNNQWMLCDADLDGAVSIAQRALFGHDSPHELEDKAVALSPSYDSSQKPSGISDEDANLPYVRLDSSTTEIRHPFWENFEPSARPLDDWRLLAGHMQRVHLELMSRLVAGHDPRPALMKIAAMRPAVQAVQQARSLLHEQPYHLYRTHHYLVMQNWSNNSAEAAKQIRAFLKENVAVRCTVKCDPKNAGELSLWNWFYLIKPVGGDLITVPHHGYLAVDQDTGEIAVFDRTEISQMHG